MSDHLYKGRPLRALFLGNHDNINLRTAVWSRRIGIDAKLMLLGDEDGPRSAIADLTDLTQGKLPDWIQRVPTRTVSEHIREFSTSDELRSYVARFDVAITSGIISLELAPYIRLPKVHISVGYEIAVCPFHVPTPRPSRSWTLRRVASAFLNLLDPERVRSQKDANDDETLLGPRTRAGIEALDVIFDGYVPNIEALTKLGQDGKVVVSSIGEDIEANRARVDPQLLESLKAEYARYERVFIWLSRLNFKDSEGGQAYKGVERYWAALERNFELVASGRIALVFGRHGNDADAFLERVKESPLFPHVRWVPHLRWSELLTWLSLPNAYLFSHFGERQIDLSGIARDALSVGAPVVCSSTKAQVAAQLGAPPPFLEATTVSDISAQIMKIMSMSELEDNALRDATRRYGERYLDFPAYMNRLWPRVIEMLEHKDNPGSGRT